MTDDEPHDMERRMTMLSSEGALVVVICSCGEKFKGRSDRDAESAHFSHMVAKGQAF